MAAPATLQLSFLQGTTWTIPIRVTLQGVPVSLAGATVTAQLRKNIDDTTASADFSCSITDAANGQCQAVLAAATTEALEYDPSPAGSRDYTTFFYDIIIALSGGDVIGPIMGEILGIPAATRTS